MRGWRSPWLASTPRSLRAADLTEPGSRDRRGRDVRGRLRDLLSSCATVPMSANDHPGGDSAPPPETTSSPTSDADYSYLQAVDENGLIDGKTVSQLSGQSTYDCLIAAGWVNAVLADNGSISANNPPEQTTQYQSDFERCAEAAATKYPNPPMSDRAIRERYGYELETRDCLITRGYTISEAPSEQAWLDAFHGTGSSTLWLPYFELFTQNNITAEEEARLKQLCPDPADRFYRQ